MFDIIIVGAGPAGDSSPTSAEGFSYAFKTALYLAEELKTGIEGIENRYQRRCKKIEWNLMAKHLKSPAMYHKGFRKMVMKSGLTSVKMSEGVE